MIWVAISTLALGFCFSGSIYGQNRKVAGSSKALLELKTTVLEANYCSDSILRLTLQLSFQNTGSIPILLRTDGFRVGRYMVSRSEAHLKAAKYELDVAPMMNSIGILKYRLEGRAKTEGAGLVTLEPGGTHTATTHVSIPVSDYKKQDSQGQLEAGSHLLQVVVWTWLDSEAFAARSRETYHSKGYLWTKSMKSDPIPFDVTKERVVSPCP